MNKLGHLGEVVLNKMTGEIGLIINITPDVWWNSEIEDFYETDTYYVLESDGSVTCAAAYYYQLLSTISYNSHL